MKRAIPTLLLATICAATATADDGRGRGQGQGQGQGQAQGQGQNQNRGPANSPVSDKSNHGQVVSECNHRANDRGLKGDDRKDFVEWCTSRGSRYGFDDERYGHERDCYRKADKKDLSGDKRQKFLGKCLDEADRQYHPKVRGAVENSERR